MFFGTGGAELYLLHMALALQPIASEWGVSSVWGCLHCLIGCFEVLARLAWLVSPVMEGSLGGLLLWALGNWLEIRPLPALLGIAAYRLEWLIRSRWWWCYIIPLYIVTFWYILIPFICSSHHRQQQLWILWISALCHSMGWLEWFHSHNSLWH